MRLISCFSSFLVLATVSLSAAELDLSPVKKWIASQADLKSLTADFVQKRSFRALRDPVERSGRVWFRTPDAFRWELGSPPSRVVVRYRDEMVFVEPDKMRAERIDPHAAVGPPGMQNMAMMEFPMAVDYADFQNRFEVLDLVKSGSRYTLTIQPRDPQARKMLRDIQMEFDGTNNHLLAFEITFRDASSLRNEFSNIRINPKIDPHLFGFDLTGYKVRDANN